MSEATGQATPDPLRVAAAAYRAAREAEATAKRKADRARAAHSDAHRETDRMRVALAEAIATAARKGTGNAEIRKVTGYTRERVRQICRAAGVEAPE